MELKKGIREKIAEMTDIPKDFMMNLPRVTILGNREIYVDNYKGLLQYSQNIISLATTNKIIIIKGEGLLITRIVENAIFVGGNILSVEYASKNNKNEKIEEMNKTIGA